MGKSYSAAPPMTIDLNKTYTATLKTERGEIVCELYAKAAPKTADYLMVLQETE